MKFFIALCKFLPRFPLFIAHVVPKLAGEARDVGVVFLHSFGNAVLFDERAAEEDEGIAGARDVAGGLLARMRFLCRVVLQRGFVWNGQMDAGHGDGRGGC